jgi:sec-independent protein translocase protein TatB
MFDMGFTEMMLIGIVALIVIGPERLPGVARTAGKYVGRLKRFMTTVKADVEQELRADELREILSQQQKELDSLKDTISEAGKDIEKETDVTRDWGEPSAAAAAVGKPTTAGSTADTGSAEKNDAATESPADPPPETVAEAEPEKPPAAEAPVGKAKT